MLHFTQIYVAGKIELLISLFSQTLLIWKPKNVTFVL